jgi:peroxiredoxin
MKNVPHNPMPRILILVLLVPLLFACSEQDETSGAQQEDTRAPSFTLPDLEGASHRLSQWKGEVVLLNFWAPWCPPCREEVPAFIELQQKYAAQGFTVVGITVDTRKNAQTFADTMGVNYPVLVAEEEGIALAKQYGNKVGALPYSVLIDRQGNIVFTHRNELTREEAEKALKGVL